jgi:hypothetical protein
MNSGGRKMKETPLTRSERRWVQIVDREIDAEIANAGYALPFADAIYRAIVQAIGMPGAIVRVTLTSLEQVPLLAWLQDAIPSERLDVAKTLDAMLDRKPGDRKVVFELCNGSAIEVVSSWWSRCEL